MKMSKIGMLALLVVLATVIGPVSATTYNVDSSMSNQDIQDIITINATDGDTINFASGTYNNIQLTATHNLNFVGNGAVIVGTGSANVLTISSTTGTNITGFNININGPENGISGQFVYNCRIENNDITNGDDAINIYKEYRNAIINNNNINDMDRDGISLVNCGDPETSTSTTVTNNNIDGTAYGIFSGGHFKGTISGNTISDSSSMGIQIIKKQNVGNLYANITDNEITETPIALELGLNVPSLLLDGNDLEGTSYSIQTITGFTYPTPHDITVTDNTFVGTVSQDFTTAITTQSGNLYL
ncbi:right-handed parallel beta-helix repeat-containing protein [Methanobacterium ferruginis]|uniref:right-handed parallel beta-helix repeat-containing protein n=1 Tax=Methanobacterium ferruginis TaxID=710191 RepID=UPI0025733650|nr:right-handed parallel beta-helix repeat-containing protein [Methanobacterium ferruginis]